MARANTNHLPYQSVSLGGVNVITHSVGVRTLVHSLSLPARLSALLILSLAISTCAVAQVDQAHPVGSTASPSFPIPPQNSGSRGGSRAEVSLHGGLLTVTANNSSLNQVLREVARQTGMKIVGGVGEERVFGTYGPAAPAAILATLLDGTGNNLLIVQNAASLPTQLILTRRTGGVTPPEPKAASSEDSDSDDESPRGGQPSLPRLPVTANELASTKSPGNRRDGQEFGRDGSIVDLSAACLPANRLFHPARHRNHHANNAGSGRGFRQDAATDLRTIAETTTTADAASRTPMTELRCACVIPNPWHRDVPSYLPLTPVRLSPVN